MMEVASNSMGTLWDFSLHAIYSLRFELTFGFAILFVWLLKQVAIGSKPMCSATARKEVSRSPRSIEKAIVQTPMVQKYERPTVLAAARHDVGIRDAGNCPVSPSDVHNLKKLAYRISQLCRANLQSALEVYHSAQQAGLNLKDIPELDRQLI